VSLLFAGPVATDVGGPSPSCVRFIVGATGFSADIKVDQSTCTSQSTDRADKIAVKFVGSDVSGGVVRIDTNDRNPSVPVVAVLGMSVSGLLSTIITANKLDITVTRGLKPTVVLPIDLINRDAEQWFDVAFSRFRGNATLDCGHFPCSAIIMPVKGSVDRLSQNGKMCVSTNMQNTKTKARTLKGGCRYVNVTEYVSLFGSAFEHVMFSQPDTSAAGLYALMVVCIIIVFTTVVLMVALCVLS
jgi:hypothetical protein